MLSGGLARRVALTLSSLLLVPACVTATDADDVEGSSSPIIGSMQDGDPTGLPEVVQVLLDNEAQDYCVGVLVSPTRVLTAAHCTGATTFMVRAPFAPHAPGADAPESVARKAGVAEHSTNFDAEVWKEDAAILDLETPIELETYPSLLDVGELGSEVVYGVAVGRRYEDRHAPLVQSKPLKVWSGAGDGYTTGLTSDYYSSGGDSGGPLFLYNPSSKTVAHVVIGIERQPEPPLERFTRITPLVLELVGQP